ncbi:MAG: PcfK-like family protein [Dyadobacter sp.]|uniref:PcfK-like family protein n=1 Tax=Dyadobacter sp. TaxID=1914288 RepID=UPI001B2CE6B1|nr:PcfK-like family protein [Dyadobacter sp.]MBO9615606.1 PcfK-like family protein [Dyadobacter sp.]
MKGTENFKKVISQHLESLAAVDSLFAETLKKPSKSIDDCITYILNEVQKSGCNGFDDSEIFGMAVHYYDEDNITVGKPVNGRVVVNHSVELSQSEIDQAKQAALDKVIADEKERIKKKSNPKKEQAPAAAQQLLF